MVMQKHILCVSYYEFLLVARRMLLEKQGYKVTPALTSQEATARCRPGDKFDLFILGHSIPRIDQQQMMKTFREHSPAPILSLRRQGEPIVPGADYYSLPDEPDRFLEEIANILAQGSRSKPPGSK